MAATFHDLSDDMLRHLARLMRSYADRHYFARTCRRACEAARAETTLFVTLSSGSSAATAAAVPLMCAFDKIASEGAFVAGGASVKGASGGSSMF